MAIEEAFDIEIPDEEAEKMTTPADCVPADALRERVVRGSFSGGLEVDVKLLGLVKAVSGRTNSTHLDAQRRVPRALRIMISDNVYVWRGVHFLDLLETCNSTSDAASSRDLRCGLALSTEGFPDPAEALCGLRVLLR